MTQEALVEQIVSAILAQSKTPSVSASGDTSSRKEESFASVPVTSARIHVGRVGTRLRTETYLKFRADHASARDAVYNDVPEALLQRLGLQKVQSLAQSRDEHLTRPDLGKQLSPEATRAVKQMNSQPRDVLVYAADGLSSKAVTANLENVLPVITEGLTQQGRSLGEPFFLQYGRVASMDHIAELTGAKVVCILVGERPGLGSAESMSAYVAYAPTVGMPEARRTVVSNIYSGGLNAVEAGAYLVEVIGKIYAAQKSGVELNS
jgi:ethanolamine ammonia-lyase small subunit